MKSVLIIGAGQFGIHIAKRMAQLRCEIMVVDSEEERINAILPLVTNAQIGDSTNANFMRSLGIPDYDVYLNHNLIFTVVFSVIKLLVSFFQNSIKF